MNDLIQSIKVLEKNELEIINSYIDTLIFYDTTVFDSNGKSRIDTTIRSSLGAAMSEVWQPGTRKIKIIV